MQNSPELARPSYVIGHAIKRAARGARGSVTGGVQREDSFDQCSARGGGRCACPPLGADAAARLASGYSENNSRNTIIKSAACRTAARESATRMSATMISRTSRGPASPNLKVERKQGAVPGGCRRAQEHFIRSEACEGCALLGRNHYRRLPQSICCQAAFYPITAKH